MHKQIRSAVEGVDGIIFVVDCSKPISKRELDSIARYSKLAPTVVIVNKIDVNGFADAYPLIKTLTDLGCKHIVPLSAMTGENLDVLKSTCAELSTDSVRHYDQNQVTDRSVRFIASELVREKILLYYQQEIPHGVGVVVTRYIDKPNIAEIDVDIIVSKDSHKPMIIGKGGEGIKKIGTQARIDIERLIDKKANLKLYVKVRPDWKNNNNYLNDIGYDIKGEQ
jgi:GTP-binding protein Era